MADSKKPDFMAIARDCVARAKTELASGEEHRVRFAALEIRMAIEAVTYRRAQDFAGDLDPEHYRTWQPKKLMQALLHADPDADKGGTYLFVIGTPPDEVRFQGRHVVFDLKQIKASYDALGSYLHLESAKHIEGANRRSLSGLRRLCDGLIRELEEVLGSTLQGTRRGKSVGFDCLRCKTRIVRRIPRMGEKFDVSCFDCGAPHRVLYNADGPKSVNLIGLNVRCPNTECRTEVSLWRDDIKPGATYHCPDCRQRFGFVLSFARLSKAGGVE